MVMDVLIYRYRAPFAERLQAAACVLCKAHSALVVVGVYSASANVVKRMAVRDTWGRLLVQHGIAKFIQETHFSLLLGNGEIGLLHSA